MMMLKTAWGEVTDKTILNCFRKSGISVEAQTGATMYHGEDHSAVEELEFDLNQLRETRPDLVPENLDTDGLLILTEMWETTNLDLCLLMK